MKRSFSRFRPAQGLLLGALLLSLPGPGLAQAEAAPTDDVLFRLHFQGGAALARSTNAPTLREIWSLPDTQNLLQLCLEKLTDASLRFYPAKAREEAAAQKALIRPLLNDLLVHQSCLELRGPTNQVHWLAAIQADSTTANRWDQQWKQIASKLGLDQVSILGGTETKGWQASSPNASFSLKLLKTKSWVTILGGPRPDQAFAGLDARLAAGHAPLPALEGNIVSLRMDGRGLGFWLPALEWMGLPVLEWSARGEEDYVRTQARLLFPEPQAMELEPWDIPKSAIRNPQNSLGSFLAIRGVRGWLHKIPGLADLKPDLLPNQLCTWGQSQFTGQTLMAAPVANVTNSIEALAYKVPPWITTAFANSYTRVLWVSNKAELVWQGLPMLAPFIKPMQNDGKTYLSAGIVPSLGATNPPTPPALFEQLDQPDLFYYNWEITERRLLHNRHYVQLGLIMDRRQAMQTNELSFRWIQQIHKRLGNSITVGTRVSPTELAFSRKSHIGLTGAELVFLTQWLKSPGFPFSFKFPDHVQPPPELLEQLKQQEEERQDRAPSEPPAAPQP